MLDISQYLVILFFLLSLFSCVEIYFSLLFYLRQRILFKKMRVWHMYTYSAGLGKTTIGIFEDAEKGLQFIRSFGFKQDIHFSRKGSIYTGNNTYSFEFTSKEAIKNGFLEMYKFYFFERGQEVMVHTLCLEEVELNEQLSFTLEDED